MSFSDNQRSEKQNNFTARRLKLPARPDFAKLIIVLICHSVKNRSYWIKLQHYKTIGNF